MSYDRHSDQPTLVIQRIDNTPIAYAYTKKRRMPRELNRPHRARIIRQRIDPRRYAIKDGLFEPINRLSCGWTKLDCICHPAQATRLLPRPVRSDLMRFQETLAPRSVNRRFDSATSPRSWRVMRLIWRSVSISLRNLASSRITNRLPANFSICAVINSPRNEYYITGFSS